MKRAGLEIAICASVLMCSLPNDCRRVINAEFDAGGDNSVSNHVQVTCETEHGVRTSIAWILDGWGIIGLNRLAMPTSVSYAGGNGAELSCTKG